MMQEHNTHTHTHTQTHVHMDILLLTMSFASIAAPASISTLIISALPLLAAHMSEVQLLQSMILIIMSNIVFSIIIIFSSG